MKRLMFCLALAISVGSVAVGQAIGADSSQKIIRNGEQASIKNLFS